MQIDPKGFLNTKMWVPRVDVMAVQNALLKVDFLGYELNLEKSKLKIKFPRSLVAVAFFIDTEGCITTIQVTKEDEDNDYIEYIGEPEEEINFEVAL